jgi:hypothetical protein
MPNASNANKPVYGEKPDMILNTTPSVSKYKMF